MGTLPKFPASVSGHLAHFPVGKCWHDLTENISCILVKWNEWFSGRGGVEPYHPFLSQFYCLRQVHLAEKLLQATHTQNRGKMTEIRPKTCFT